MDLESTDKYLDLCKEIILNNLDRDTTSVFLFGSRADNTQRHDSDIDIGLISNKAIEIKTISRIYSIIEKSIVPYHVDIVDFTKVDQEFKKIALQNIVIWNKSNTSS
jgi:predicted nucleotidyltransferase